MFLKFAFSIIVSTCFAALAQADLVGEWTFSEGAGGKTSDSVGGAFLQLSCAPGGTNPAWDAQAGFRDSTGLIFRSSERSFLRTMSALPDAMNLNGESTLEMLFKPASIESMEEGATRWLVMGPSGGTDNLDAGLSYGLSLLVRNGQTMVASQFTDSSGQLVRVKLPVPIESGKWIYVASTLDASGALTIYAGQQPGEDNVASLVSTTYSGKYPKKEFLNTTMVVGSAWGSECYFDGHLGILRFYNKALTKSAIEKNYSAVPNLPN